MEKLSYTMKKSNGWSMPLVFISGRSSLLDFGATSQDTRIESLLNTDFYVVLGSATASSATSCCVLAPKV